MKAPTEIWAVGDSIPAAAQGVVAVTADTRVRLDTVSFTPRIDEKLNDGNNSGLGVGIRRLAIVTSFAGARYHPDIVRGIGESPVLIAGNAGSIATFGSSHGMNGLLIDFLEMTADDLPALMDVTRAIGDSARVHGTTMVGMIVPGEDSAGYPARILTRVADLLVVRLFPEHGLGNPAGPIVSPVWFARRLGLRAGEAGVNRIVAGIPADGILWNTRGGARRVSYSEALSLARAANTGLVRDPASGNLHAASTRDGWELWVADSELVERLIAQGRKIGVVRFALFGLDGADPELWQRLPLLIRR